MLRSIRLAAMLAAGLALVASIAAPAAFAAGASPKADKSTVRASAADDALPGVVLRASPFSDAVDEDTDSEDVFFVTLQPGQTLHLLLHPIGGDGDADLLLYPPGTTDISSSDDAVATSREVAEEDENIDYTVPAGAGGTYYVDVWAFEGEVSYTLTWSVTSGGTSGNDDALPGVPLRPSPFADSVDDVSDSEDVFNVALGAGQSISITVRTTSGTGDVDLALFPPGTTDIDDLDNAVATSREEDEDESITYTVPDGASGTYYVNVWAFDGSAGYSLTWSTTGGADGTEELVLTASSGPSVVAYRGIVTVRARMKDAGSSAVGGKPMELQRSFNGSSWSTFGTYTGTAAGAYAASVRIDRRTYFRWHFEGDGEYSEATSPRVYSTSKAYVTAPSVPSVIRTGGRMTRYTWSGTVMPANESGSARFYLQGYEGGRWKAVFWDDVDLSVYSTRIRYSGTSGIQVNHKERYRARIYYRDPAHVGTYSAWRYFVAKP